MNALLLNGIPDKDSKHRKIHDIITEVLKQNQFYINDILLRDRKVTPCQGCFDCWINTPGICRIDDYGRVVVQQIVKNDLIIHLTPIIFGGYSSLLKKVMDRSIPLLLPFFKTVEGEIHHKQRYENRPCIIVIGYQDNPNKKFEETFRKITYRNSLNFEAPLYKTLTYSMNQDVSELQNELNNILKEVKSYNG